MTPIMKCAAGVLATLSFLLTTSEPAYSGGKAGVYGIYMEPRSSDSKDFSDPGWGVGFHVVTPLEQVHNLLAGVAGLEFVNLMSETHTFYDPYIAAQVDQTTSQDYYRLYVGPSIGPHGPGFLRPYAGTNIALVVYNINTHAEIADPDQPYSNTVSSRTEAAFGWDVNGGVDLNIKNRFPVDIGVRYLKSFNVPQQLGTNAVTVYPKYFQFYIGIGLSFGEIGKESENQP